MQAHNMACYFGFSYNCCSNPLFSRLHLFRRPLSSSNPGVQSFSVFRISAVRPIKFVWSRIYGCTFKACLRKYYWPNWSVFCRYLYLHQPQPPYQLLNGCGLLLSMFWFLWLSFLSPLVKAPNLFVTQLDLLFQLVTLMNPKCLAGVCVCVYAINQLGTLSWHSGRFIILGSMTVFSRNKLLDQDGNTVPCLFHWYQHKPGTNSPSFYRLSSVALITTKKLLPGPIAMTASKREGEGEGKRYWWVQPERVWLHILGNRCITFNWEEAATGWTYQPKLRHLSFRTDSMVDDSL